MGFFGEKPKHRSDEPSKKIVRPKGQHHFVCPDPECSVVVFVDTMTSSDNSEPHGVCPGDAHPFMNDPYPGVLIDKEF